MFPVELLGVESLAVGRGPTAKVLPREHREHVWLEASQMRRTKEAKRPKWDSIEDHAGAIWRERERDKIHYMPCLGHCPRLSLVEGYSSEKKKTYYIPIYIYIYLCVCAFFYRLLRRETETEERVPRVMHMAKDLQVVHPEPLKASSSASQL